MLKNRLKEVLYKNHLEYYVDELFIMLELEDRHLTEYIYFVNCLNDNIDKFKTLDDVEATEMTRLILDLMSYMQCLTQPVLNALVLETQFLMRRGHDIDAARLIKFIAVSKTIIDHSHDGMRLSNILKKFVNSIYGIGYGLGSTHNELDKEMTNVLHKVYIKSKNMCLLNMAN